MKYKAALFDMDGTTLDSLEDMYLSVNYTLRAFGFPERSREEVRAFVGNGAARLIALSVPEGIGEKTTAEALAFYKAYYDIHCLDHTAPYAGIREALRLLGERGIQTAIVTNKPDSAAQELNARFFAGLTGLALGEKSGVKRKPSPDMVLLAAEKLGVSPEECVYIGDSEVDVETARSAGMDCISVTWGFRTTEELRSAGAECFAEDPEELPLKILCL